MSMLLLPLLLLAGAGQSTPPVSNKPLAGHMPGADDIRDPEGEGPKRPNVLMVAEPAALFIATCDGNGDGRTTRDELRACIARTFAISEPGNHPIGYIAYSDWAKQWLGDGNVLPSPFEVDGNGDNQITLEEIQDRFDRMFTLFDRNKDGAVTRAELLTTRPGRPEGAAPRQSGGTPGGGGRGGGRGRGGGGGGFPGGGGGGGYPGGGGGAGGGGGGFPD